VAILKTTEAADSGGAKGVKRTRRAIDWGVLTLNRTLIGRNVREQEIEVPPKVA